jgi:hypothetical protein
MIVSKNADELDAKLRAWRKSRQHIGKFYGTAWLSLWRLKTSRSV